MCIWTPLQAATVWWSSWKLIVSSSLDPEIDGEGFFWLPLAWRTPQPTGVKSRRP